MKNFLFFFFLISSLELVAQNLPVSQNPENKKVLIEEFTAYRCGYCPSAHALVNDITAMIGESNVVTVAYHVGSLAEPTNASDPDFRTSDGGTLQAFFGATGTPLGPINRENFDSGPFELAPANWLTNSYDERDLIADVNIAMDVTIASSTRTALIDVEVFYTTNTNESHFLTIGYSQNGINAPQTTYNPNYNPDYYNTDGSYRHQHVFRAFVTPRQGVSVDANETAVISEHFEVGIPYLQNNIEVELDSLEFFAILHKGENSSTNSEVLNVARSIPNQIVGTTALSASNLEIYPNPGSGSFQLQGVNEEDVIKVTSLTGELIDFQRVSNSILIEQPGLYLVEVIGNKGPRTSKLVVN